MLCRGPWVFALRSVSQNALFELSKTIFRNVFNFLSMRGVPYRQKVTGAEKKVKKKFQKKNLKDWTKWNRKMGGRSCFITSGAFGHGLMKSHTEKFHITVLFNI